jgi:hypothetical protein
MPFRSSEREALEERKNPLHEAAYGRDFEIPDTVTPWPHRPSAKNGPKKTRLLGPDL